MSLVAHVDNTTANGREEREGRRVEDLGGLGQLLRWTFFGAPSRLQVSAACPSQCPNFAGTSSFGLPKLDVVFVSEMHLDFCFGKGLYSR